MKRRQILASTVAALLSKNAFASTTPSHVVVIGAGIIGSSIAYHLTRYGAKVTILDKGQPAAGTTFNSFAWLNAFQKRPFSYFNLNYLGIMGWHRLQQEIGPKLRIQWGGGISWARPHSDAERDSSAILTQLQKWGYPIQGIDAAEIEALLPGVNAGPLGSAWKSSLDGTLDPVETTKVLLAEAIARGAQLHTGTRVKSLDIRDGKVAGVVTDQATIPADDVVLAMGNDSTELAATAGLTVPLKRSLGVLAHSKPVAPFFQHVVMPPDCDIKQNPDGRIISGSNFGDSGELQPTRALGDQFFKRVRDYFPQIPALEVDYMTLGHRVLPVDGHPIVGNSKNYPNVYVAAMHSGMSMAPIMGQLIAMEVLDQVPTDLLSDYRPGRFA